MSPSNLRFTQPYHGKLIKHFAQFCFHLRNFSILFLIFLLRLVLFPLHSFGDDSKCIILHLELLLMDILLLIELQNVVSI